VRTLRRGVTIMEMIVVLAILIIAAAIATPTLQSLSGGPTLNAAADTVKARWAEARARAVAEGRPYRFAIMENTGKFRVAPDSPEFWDGTTTDSSSSDGTRPPLVVEDKLPQEMRFLSSPNASGAAQGQSSDWTCPIVFMPDGCAQQDGQIVFGGAGARPLVLRIKAATGVATTSR
jgi:prepilin-type N-terminal cleavage/methylation domain-containing protein